MPTSPSLVANPSSQNVDGSENGCFYKCFSNWPCCNSGGLNQNNPQMPQPSYMSPSFVEANKNQSTCKSIFCRCLN